MSGEAYAASAARSRARRDARRRRRRLIRRAWGLAVLAIGVAIAVATLTRPEATRARDYSRAARHGPPAAGRPAHSPAPGQPSRSVPGRWLVPLGGPQPSVAAENSHAGTSSWRLPGPAGDVAGTAHGSVAGYVSAPAVVPGAIEQVYVNAPGAQWVRIRIFRIGWYGGAGGREMFVSRRLPVRVQPACAHDFETGLTRCDWHPTLSLPIPSSLPSGVYIAKLTIAEGASDCLFVVESARPQPLLAQLPTATYEAYNAWGGDSLYPGGADRVGLTGTTQGVEVSYDRPYDSVTGAGQFFARDVAMVWFLERHGYPVSYTTSESVDGDPAQLTGHRALLDFGHSEYWSRREEDGWARALRRGTSLIFLSSDTLAWRVRFERSGATLGGAARPGVVIVAYKEHALMDPHPADPTGSFPDRGAGLSGSAYLGCITPRVPQPGPPVYRYYGWAPAPGLRPAWLFARTGITSATRIAGIVGYELDQRTAFSPPGTQLVGYGAAPCMRHRGEGPGEPFALPGDDLAETTLYTARSGATVFGSGTLGWELGLEPVPGASPDAPSAPDPRIVAMTRNLLDHVLGTNTG